MTTGTERVQRLLAAARGVMAHGSEERARAMALLVETTRLSPQNIDLCLERCLELDATTEDVEALCRSVIPAPSAHVVLSANVFVGALRAIALGLAASSVVSVKPSRRDATVTRMLHAADPDAFRIVDAIAPQPGDVVFAYGSDETLVTLGATLPRGVLFSGHGTGFGAVAVAAAATTDVDRLAQAIVDDVVPFDQRGCLSPRVVMVRGVREVTEWIAQAVSHELGRRADVVPLGALSARELADRVWFEQTTMFTARLHAGTGGCVSVDCDGQQLVVPPIGRNLHVVRVPDFAPMLAQCRPWLTSVGTHGPLALTDGIAAAVPEARIVPVGSMQRPRFDGPVDRRAHPRRLD